MDKTQDILDLIPENYEPGANLPDAIQIRSRLAVLDRQAIVVDTLLWMAENKSWLPLCDFELNFDDDYVFIKEDDIQWESGSDPSVVVLGATNIENIANYLGDSISGETTETVKKVVSALNQIHFDFSKALEALAPIAPTPPNGQSKEAWLGSHLAGYEAQQLQESTQEAGQSQTSPRRRSI